MRLRFLAAAAMVATAANAQPIPEICKENTFGTLFQTYLLCISEKAQPLMMTEMSATEVAESAIAACADARADLANRGGICSVGHPVNLDDENHYLRDLIALRIAEVRAGKPPQP